MSKIPRYLRPGDTIGIVCPAGFMELTDVMPCIETLQSWGFRVKIGDTVGRETGNYFSGSDEVRLIDFQRMIDDDEVSAILCARGGYGISRIIDRVDFTRFKKSPRWIIGYSDVTVLHAHLLARYNICSLHAPMAAAFKDGLEGNPYLQSWKDLVEGHPMLYSVASHPYNRYGRAKGKLVGGNLTLIAHLIGSKSEIDTKGRILFIEDIGEYVYNVDRMMIQLKRAGKLENLAGLVVGGFTDMKDTSRPHGSTAEQVIRDAVSEYDYPVCFNFPVSHGKENYPIKIGINGKLRVGADRVILEE